MQEKQSSNSVLTDVNLLVSTPVGRYHRWVSGAPLKLRPWLQLVLGAPSQNVPGEHWCATALTVTLL